MVPSVVPVFFLIWCTIQYSTYIILRPKKRTTQQSTPTSTQKKEDRPSFSSKIALSRSLYNCHRNWTYRQGHLFYPSHSFHSTTRHCTALQLSDTRLRPSRQRQSEPTHRPPVCPRPKTRICISYLHSLRILLNLYFVCCVACANGDPTS